MHLLNIQLFITNLHKYSLHNCINTWYILVALWYILAVLFTHVVHFGGVVYAGKTVIIFIIKILLS